MKKVLLTTTALIVLGIAPRPPQTWPHGPTPRRPDRGCDVQLERLLRRRQRRLGIEPQSLGQRPPASFSRWAAMTQPAAPSVVRSATAGRLLRGCSAWKRRATGLTSTVAMLIPLSVPSVKNDTRDRCLPDCSPVRSATPRTTSCSTSRAVPASDLPTATVCSPTASACSGRQQRR